MAFKHRKQESADAQPLMHSFGNLQVSSIGGTAKDSAPQEQMPNNVGSRADSPQPYFISHPFSTSAHAGTAEPAKKKCASANQDSPSSGLPSNPFSSSATPPPFSSGSNPFPPPSCSVPTAPSFSFTTTSSSAFAEPSAMFGLHSSCTVKSATTRKNSSSSRNKTRNTNTAHKVTSSTFGGKRSQPAASAAGSTLSGDAKENAGASFGCKTFAFKVFDWQKTVQGDFTLQDTVQLQVYKTRLDGLKEQLPEAVGLVSSSTKLLERFELLQNAGRVSTSIAYTRRLDEFLRKNAVDVKKIQSKHSTLCRKLREKVEECRVSVKDNARAELMKLLSTRVGLLKDWMEALDVLMQEKSSILESFGSKIELQEDNIQLNTSQNVSVDVDIVSKCHRECFDIFDKLLDRYCPQAVRLAELTKEFRVWESREMTWLNLFLHFSEMEEMPAKAKEFQTLQTSVGVAEKELETQVSNTLTALTTYFMQITNVLKTTQAVSLAKQSVEQDMLSAQNHLQVLLDAEAVAARIQKGQRECIAMKSNLLAKQKQQELLSLEIKWSNNVEERERLKAKQMEEEAELPRLLSKIADFDSEIERNRRILLENFPELICNGDGNVQQNFTLGSRLAATSSSNTAESSSSSSILDLSTTLDDFQIVKSIVPDKVFLAHDKLRQKCVVKKLVGHKEFQKEAERLWKLQHPLIVPIAKIFLDKAQPHTVCFMQMPFYEQGNLRVWTTRMQEHIAQKKQFDSQLTLIEVQNTFRQICQALAHIHSRGIAHRDLKPENVLLSSSGRIALCDFGISSDFGGEIAALIQSTNYAGTSGYLAPEALQTSRSGNCGTAQWKKNPSALDMWSLGCMMTELLAKVLPVALPAQFPTEIEALTLDIETIKLVHWPTLTDFFELPSMKGYVRLCSQLLHMNPDERPTAHEVLVDDFFRVKASAFDPVSRLNLVVRSLAALQQEGKQKEADKKPKLIVLPSSEDQDVICQHLLSDLGARLEEFDVCLPWRVLGHNGYHRPLGEIMEMFFSRVVLPKHKLFTLSLTESEKPTPEETEDREAMVLGKKALPSASGNPLHFRVVGLLMAKCLVEGIRMPILLNSLCLEYILERRLTPPTDVDESLQFLAETSTEEIIFYRNLLRERQKNFLEVGVILPELGSNGTTTSVADEQFVTEENKAAIVSLSIWRKLIEARQTSLQSIRQGLQSLKIYGDLQAVSGKELQILFFGNDFVNLENIRDSFVFTVDTWVEHSKMNQIKEWVQKWTSEVSELTIRILLVRCFGTYLFSTLSGTETVPRIFVVQSPDNALHVSSRNGGILMIPARCESYQALEELLRDELFLTSMKSDVEKQNRLSKKEWQEVVQAMRSEIRAGGWYQCPNGHAYSIGECGGAVQTARCSVEGCGAVIGGSQHLVAEGNSHFNVDRSTKPAWPA